MEDGIRTPGCTMSVRLYKNHQIVQGPSDCTKTIDEDEITICLQQPKKTMVTARV